MVDTEGQGGHKHTALQGLNGVDGATHEAAKLTQELSVDVANGQSLTPVAMHTNTGQKLASNPVYRVPDRAGC